MTILPQVLKQIMETPHVLVTNKLRKVLLFIPVQKKN